MQWPLEYRNLLQKCWATCAEERPVFSEIVAVLMELVQSVGAVSLEDLHNDGCEDALLCRGTDDDEALLPV